MQRTGGRTGGWTGGEGLHGGAAGTWRLLGLNIFDDGQEAREPADHCDVSSQQKYEDQPEKATEASRGLSVLRAAEMQL